MTRDEEALRRALHSAADSIEPAPDGLTRIRERVAARRHAPAGWLLAGGTGLAGLAVPRLHAAGSRVAELLRAVLQPLLDWFADEGPRHARRRPVWRRPAVAISAVVFIAAAAGIAASGLPSEIAQNSATNSATKADGAVSGHGGSGVNGSGQPYGSSSVGRHGAATPSPSCSPSASRGKSSGSHGNTNPSPTQSPSSSASPAQSPSPPASPSPSTPTPTEPSSEGSVGNLQGTLPGSPDQPASTPSTGTQAESATRLAGSGSATQASPSPSPSC